MTLNLEILYSDDTSVVIDALDITAIIAAVKTNVLAMALWEPVEGKRIPHMNKEEFDTYTLIIDITSGVVILGGVDDADVKWVRYGNPSGSDGYRKADTPPGFHNVQSANSQKFIFLGGKVSTDVWRDTKTKRDEMKLRDRDV